ncbi:hypothetical protein K7432_016877 [Basidiobolus ranarum]|uniref:Glucose-methanol-choline oxidoreductase N-terminal domain-containing protein n=1 Tax=Basidiobolus ranarum TaxID=34480 RepID=A0ABR2WE35_9FUNG
MRKYFNRLMKKERESPDENIGWASFSFLDIVSGFRSGGDVNGGASEDSLYPNRHAGWHLPPQNIDKENGYVRSSVRYFIKYAVQKAPQSLTVWTETLVTKVLIDDGNTATGVEYMKGANLYKASPLHKNHGSNKRAVYAKREIIISGGAFNTPQLLMLSGIGDPHQLKNWDIPVKSGLVGVGKNLQDHQEISLNLQMQYPHKDLAECRNSANPLENPCFVAYAEKHTGPYAASGAIFGISTKTSKELEEPNVYILGAVAMFYGYHQGYSIEAGNSTDKVSFVMLKGHTKNNNGYVQLRSSDPTDVPDINFLFWSDGDDDIRDNAKQLKWMRKQFEQGPLNKQYVKKELLPGLNANVEEYVRHNSWGHHACCTAKMGSKDDPLAVLDNQLRVYGIQGLRVVDASIFPKIPGFFVTVPIEMVSEKAADMIIEQANKESDRCTLRSSEYTV